VTLLDTVALVALVLFSALVASHVESWMEVAALGVMFTFVGFLAWLVIQ